MICTRRTIVFPELARKLLRFRPVTELAQGVQYPGAGDTLPVTRYIREAAMVVASPVRQAQCT